MRKNVPEILSGLVENVEMGREETLGWLRHNLTKLTQYDLLSGRYLGCPCGACHERQYRLFTQIFRSIGAEALRELLKNLFLEHPCSVTLPETAYILLNWLKSNDIQGYMKPFPAIHPLTGVNHLDTLDELARSRMAHHRIYKNAVCEMESIVETLSELGVEKDQFVEYQVHCHQKWLSNYKPQMVSAKSQPREESFPMRFHAFQYGEQKNFRYYFDLNEDRDLLAHRLLQPDFIDIIPELVRHLPKRSDSSWVKFGKRLMEQRREKIESGGSQ